MLEKIDLKKNITKEEFKSASKKLREQLSSLQQQVLKQKLPVIILFEGWGASGKGELISDLILNLDPRWCKVHSVTRPTELERRKPVLWRYWNFVPKAGNFSVLDRSWYLDVTTARLEEDVSAKELTRRLNSINTFERELTDAGYLIIKFFVHISKKEQKERFEKLAKDRNTQWRVTEQDWKRNRQYEKYCESFEEAIGYTNTTAAPWHLISGTDRRAAALDVISAVIARVTEALNQEHQARLPAQELIQPGAYPFLPMPKLSEVPLNRTMDRDEYQKKLEEEQKQLRELHSELYLKKIPVILAFEGWDAAGKGGTIRRVAKALDPRGYQVVPIASPTPDEKARQYLWRFWKNLPRDGHIAIFDRTWYGRVLVERVENFCTEAEWSRAYREINEFERELADWGAVILKFWLQIDQEEQLRRFQSRQNNPEKSWKITDEDWRNRSKWDQYEACVNDMLKYTSTRYAPWHIIESQDKKFGRIQTLELITDAILDKCGEKHPHGKKED
ncbi:Polyphosphate:AMP phosphotransferase [Caprobacter fermentans]|uniref:Polyphosphate:AMP phosphotransferase n=1 Tax=Caproicibacter fermentans TaxID=2576756 RepID=A0A6N8HXX0_9FIRM|nr:polyphosphate:AMP phosphotransferase [Caproicibacter fermentans]MVB10370.1 Polyphosphate:AMP phosphotransferase [Caproicibacter fermentans]OCN01282.1 polyphosphate:AMP phosphotransferase [Clostridium sp. W14A]QNK40407.1 polyphosphate:AMP phosphotransferase [Caproicibacter fermentans]